MGRRRRPTGLGKVSMNMGMNGPGYGGDGERSSSEGDAPLPDLEPLTPDPRRPRSCVVCGAKLAEPSFCFWCMKPSCQTCNCPCGGIDSDLTRGVQLADHRVRRGGIIR